MSQFLLQHRTHYDVTNFTTAQHSLRCRFFYADTTLTTKDIFFFPILYSVMQLLIRNNIVKKKVQKNTAPLLWHSTQQQHQKKMNEFNIFTR